MLGWAGHSNKSEQHGTVADVLDKVRSFSPKGPLSWVGLLVKKRWSGLDLEKIQTYVNFPDN